ncbi:MAG: pyridoxal-phosphate dependent enzyme [Paracoccaceae bacterium]
MNSELSDTARNAAEARTRITDYIYQTPLLPSRALGDEYGCDLRFKAENFQLTGSFKMRGAASKMTSLRGNGGLITASSGNHGIACSRAASIAGKKLTVVLPETVANAKLEKIKSFGVEVVLHGSESGLAEVHAQSLAKTRGLTYVSPYNDPVVVAGQGTIGLELLEQAENLDNIFVAMGGGGLIGGIGSVLKNTNPETRVIGVSAKNSAALAASMLAGEIVDTEHYDTLADGVAGGVDKGSVTLPLAMQVIDEVLICDEAEIASALKRMALDENQIVEGAAALALAGFIQIADRLRSQTSVVLICGANFDQDRVLSIING